MNELRITILKKYVLIFYFDFYFLTFLYGRCETIVPLIITYIYLLLFIYIIRYKLLISDFYSVDK